MRTGVEEKFISVPSRANGIEFLKARSDRIHQIVTTSTKLIARRAPTFVRGSFAGEPQWKAAD